MGEGPGAEEDKQGRPFVGRAGDLLNRMIAAMGMQREDCYITNVVLCRPPENRTPLPVEIETCSVHLYDQLHLVQPRIIVALGGTAAKTLLKTDRGIMSLRGTWKKWEEIPVMPTFHPAALLRNASWKALTWEDLQLVMAEIKKEQI